MTEIKLEAAIPVLRIYNIAKAKEFYVDFLGFRSTGNIAPSRICRPTDKAPKLTDPFGNVLRFDDATNHT